MADNQDTFKGYSQAQLCEAFQTVQPASDWKDPIKAWIPSDRYAVTIAAVQFYTATTPRMFL